MSDIRRRQFITLLGGAAAWPLAARGQQRERMRRIGVLMYLTQQDTESKVYIAAFLQGLGALGWTVGNNLQVDYRWTGADAGLIHKYAAELVALVPDVILVAGGSHVGPLLQVTRTVPIVFVQVVDAVGDCRRGGRPQDRRRTLERG
jgi:putative ABC transport system substrate-binding protein